MSTVLTQMPSEFSSGETVTYTRSFSDFPATSGYSLAVFIAGARTAKATVTTSGASFVVTFDTTATKALDAGSYEWEERVTKAGAVTVAARGRVNVRANIETAANGDFQSWAEQTLVVIEARIKGNVTADVMRYTIAGRALERYSIEELMKIRSQLRSELNAVRRGGTFSTPVLVRFTGTGYCQ